MELGSPTAGWKLRLSLTKPPLGSKPATEAPITGAPHGTHALKVSLTLNDGAVFGGGEDGQVIGSDNQTCDGELVATQNSNVGGSWGLDLGRQGLGHSLWLEP